MRMLAIASKLHNWLSLFAAAQESAVYFSQACCAMQDHLDLVRSDFQFVFKDIMDLDHFESSMLFSDPISKFTFFGGKLMP